MREQHTYTRTHHTLTEDQSKRISVHSVSSVREKRERESVCVTACVGVCEGSDGSVVGGAGALVARPLGIRMGH